MSVKPIRTRADRDRALAEIERLMGAKRSSPQADRLEVLAALVVAYETAHDPIDLPEPIEAIEAHMSERGLGSSRPRAAARVALVGVGNPQSQTADVAVRDTQAREGVGYPDRYPCAALPT
jgi:hypothetical protein